MMKHFDVVAAVIIYDNKILCMQRNKSKYLYTSYKYEFPGGKIECGESETEALERELKEEMALSINITPQDYLLTTEHNYPDFSITLHAYLCKVSSPKFIMKEHINFQWLNLEELSILDWAEADLPIVKYLENKKW